MRAPASPTRGPSDDSALNPRPPPPRMPLNALIFSPAGIFRALARRELKRGKLPRKSYAAPGNRGRMRCPNGLLPAGIAERGCTFWLICSVVSFKSCPSWRLPSRTSYEGLPLHHAVVWDAKRRRWNQSGKRANRHCEGFAPEYEKAAKSNHRLSPALSPFTRPRPRAQEIPGFTGSGEVQRRGRDAAAV